MKNNFLADFGNLLILAQIERQKAETAAPGDTYQATPNTAASQDTPEATRLGYDTTTLGQAAQKAGAQ